MDYKKKYKNALAHAREIHRNEDEKKRDMEWLFPELKESEDERIRKALITFFNRFPYDSIESAGTNAKEALAWLEKQGEQQSSASTLTQEEVQKLHDHLEMHKQLPKSEPQTITFTDSGTMQVIDKLNEIIGKLGDIYEVLSNPFQFPYRDYTPPQEPWYKTHGVEKVTPVTCETLSGTKGEKSPLNSEEEDNEE